MPAAPTWFAQLNWSEVWSVASLATHRSRIPQDSGCYVFTSTASGLRPNHVLYVGKAKNLRRRLGGYLVDYRNTRPTTHKGRAFVFEQRHCSGDHALFVRWVLFGGKAQEAGDEPVRFSMAGLHGPVGNPARALGRRRSNRSTIAQVGSRGCSKRGDGEMLHCRRVRHADQDEHYNGIVGADRWA